MGLLLDGIFDWFADKILDVFNALIAAITGVLLRTPDVTVLPQVQTLTDRSIAIVDTVYVLVFVAAGVLTMSSSGGERAKYNAKDLLARCVVGFVAAHFSQLIAAKMIELSNALTGALTDTPTGPNGGLDGMKANLAAARDTAGVLLFVVCAAVIVFLVAATALSMLSRFAVVMVLTTVAPIALACHALPQTDPVARMWWRAYLGTLAVPVVQGAFLAAGQWMLLDPRHMLPQLGLPFTEPGGVINLFVVIVLLFSAVKVPGWMRKIVMAPGGRSQSILATALRVVLIQRVSKVLPGVRRIAG
jgi:hypothetical protein